ncbi:MAG TPA: DNA polymerase I [Thermodesulfovibrionia bacterium]|nr:DNA polymerase I [Thermodesulfovibrionia bacterium]
MPQPKQTLYLIDGHSYIYRAFYAVKGLQTSKGLPTNAIFGFTNMLLKLSKEKSPDFMAVVFDPPGATERSKIFKAYKAQRPRMPEELVVQLPYIKGIVKGLNVAAFEVQGFEADDVIAVLARKAETNGFSVVIVTADKDLKQLLSDSVRIYDAAKDKVTEAKDIVERYGLPPSRLKEVMALTGDAVDNIPGVPGVGEKTAVALIKEFGSLENIIKEPNKIKQAKIREKVTENIDNIRLSLDLVTLNFDVPIDIALEDLQVKEPDWEALFPLFRQCEFSQFMKLVPAPKTAIKYKLIRHKNEFPTCQGRIAVAIATAQEGTGSKELAGAAFGIDSDNCLYLSLADDSESGFSKEEKTAFLKSLLEQPEISIIIHDLKAALHILRQNGINPEGVLFDTMVSSYLLNPNKDTHSLETAATDYLGLKLPEQGSIEEAACARAQAVVQLYHAMEPLLEEQGLSRLFHEIEMPLVSVLAQMEETGVKVLADRLNSISHELKQAIASLEDTIYTLAGGSFNINSPKQLQEVLFTRLGLRSVKKTKTGFSTNVEVLQSLSESHALPGAILEHRSLFKMKTTYVDTLPGFINPKTGRIHPQFNQAVTATGRLSSSEPNLQNIPVKGQWAQQIRSAFAAEDGFVFVSSDYSQIELRILAHLSQDQGLIRAFHQGADIHTATAAELFGVDADQVTSEMRRKAKTINFGILYGISPYGLSQQLGITHKEAGQYIERFFEVKHGVKNYIEMIKNHAKETGYVTTIFGRRRNIPEIRSTNKTIAQQGERMAVNTPVQGSAADIIKIAMIQIAKRLQNEKAGTRMLIQVHDELLFEVPEAELEKATALIQQEMESAADLLVPLTVQISYGKDWAMTQ